MLGAGPDRAVPVAALLSPAVPRRGTRSAPGVLIGRMLTRRGGGRGRPAGRDGRAGPDRRSSPRRRRSWRSTYRNLPILDLTAPTQDQLREAVAFIAEESAQGTVYVHCKIGYSRSAAVVGAYLLASGQAATVEEAIALLRQFARRSSSGPKREALAPSSEARARSRASTIRKDEPQRHRGHGGRPRKKNSISSRLSPRCPLCLCGSFPDWAHCLWASRASRFSGNRTDRRRTPTARTAGRRARRAARGAAARAAVPGTPGRGTGG